MSIVLVKSLAYSSEIPGTASILSSTRPIFSAISPRIMEHIPAPSHLVNLVHEFSDTFQFATAVCLFGSEINLAFLKEKIFKKIRFLRVLELISTSVAGSAVSSELGDLILMHYPETLERIYVSHVYAVMSFYVSFDLELPLKLLKNHKNESLRVACAGMILEYLQSMVDISISNLANFETSQVVENGKLIDCLSDCIVFKKVSSVDSAVTLASALTSAFCVFANSTSRWISVSPEQKSGRFSIRRDTPEELLLRLDDDDDTGTDDAGENVKSMTRYDNNRNNTTSSQLQIRWERYFTTMEFIWNAERGLLRTKNINNANNNNNNNSNNSNSASEQHDERVAEDRTSLLCRTGLSFIMAMEHSISSDGGVMTNVVATISILLREKAISAKWFFRDGLINNFNRRPPLFLLKFLFRLLEYGSGEVAAMIFFDRDLQLFQSLSDFAKNRKNVKALFTKVTELVMKSYPFDSMSAILSVCRKIQKHLSSSSSSGKRWIAADENDDNNDNNEALMRIIITKILQIFSDYVVVPFFCTYNDDDDDDDSHMKESLKESYVQKLLLRQSGEQDRDDDDEKAIDFVESELKRLVISKLRN